MHFSETQSRLNKVESCSEHIALAYRLLCPYVRVMQSNRSMMDSWLLVLEWILDPGLDPGLDPALDPGNDIDLGE